MNRLQSCTSALSRAWNAAAKHNHGWSAFSAIRRPLMENPAALRSITSTSIRQSAETQSTQPPPAVVDGMPRYPSTSSTAGLLRATDYFGTIVFANSGAILAAQSGMDIFGVSVVATITAVGGGTIRDLLIGNRPVFWMEETEYIWMSLATAIATFYMWPTVELALGIQGDNTEFLMVSDAVGLAAFCVIGSMNGIRKGLNSLICVICGILTATGGGVVRDTLVKRPVRILHSHAEIYATTAACGSAAYLMARKLQAPVGTRIAAGVSTAFLARYFAWTYGIRLPTYKQGAMTDTKNKV